MDKLWEIFVCMYETFLLCYLLDRKLGFRRTDTPRLVLAFFGAAAVLSVLTFSNITATQRMLLMMLVYTLVGFFAFGDGVRKKGFRPIFWSACYLFIAALSDNIAFTLANLLTDNPLEQLMNFGMARIQFSLLFLLLCTILIWAVGRIGAKNPLFPLPITIFLIALMVVGILATESILDIAMALGAEPALTETAKQLSFMSYIIFAMLFSLVGIFEYSGVVRRKNQELEQQQRLTQLEQHQYDVLVSAAASLREWKHDYQGQLRLIQTLIEEKQYDELHQFAAALDTALPTAGLLLSTGNVAIDAVISLRMMEARRAKIPFHTTVYLPKHIPLDDVSFSSLIANLLDNAIAGCQKVEQGELTLEIKPWRNMLYLSCVNSSDGVYRIGKNGTLLSTKKTAHHGIGLRRMTQMVEQVGGSIQLIPAENTFSVTIMIPLEGEST